MDRIYLKVNKRNSKGFGRKESIKSVRIPESVKRDLDSWKSAYEEKLKCKVSYEQMFRWWMDNIGYSEQNWDKEIRDCVVSNSVDYTFIFNSRKELIDHLNRTGRFWEYCNHASESISDDELIIKSLLYLELEDLPQLFSLFGYDRCRELFKKRILNKGKYYSNISFLLESYYF